VDRSGNLIDKDSIPMATLEKMGHGWSHMAISPSGNVLAFHGRSFGTGDLWLLSLETGDPERITFDPAEDECPVWSPDGNAIAYTSSMTGTTRRLFIKNFSGAGNQHLIRTWPRHIHFSSWSPDGKWLAAFDYNTINGSDCYAISIDSGDSIPIAIGQANEDHVRVSPDGRWLAFQSDESGDYQIYVTSFPKLEGKRQISINGGTSPCWNQIGKFIYYLSNGFMIAQPVETGNELIIGKPVILFKTDASSFNVSPDGQKFYLVRRNLKRHNPPLNLITNWFDELKTNK
jgi:Tol biopolymer transport system component